jgi:hypothetical protein
LDGKGQGEMPYTAQKTSQGLSPDRVGGPAEAGSCAKTAIGEQHILQRNGHLIRRFESHLGGATFDMIGIVREKKTVRYKMNIEQ